MNNKYLIDLIKEGEKVSEDALAIFGHLSPEQMNWKPSPDKWSVGQCFEHLIKTNEGYIGLLNSVADDTRTKRLWESMPFLPGFFGKMIYNACKPETKSKIKTFKIIEGNSSDLDVSIINRFQEQLAELLIALKKSDRQLSHNKLIVTSPLSPVVIYSFEMACKIVITHCRRHFKQAQEVMALAEFPKS